MRKTPPANALFSALLCITPLFFRAQPICAASYGNTDAAHARFITADGAVCVDNITNVNPSTWFAVNIHRDHSYEFNIWAPGNNVLQTDPVLTLGLREADGTTIVVTSGNGLSEPEMWDTTQGAISVGGDRATLINTGPGTTRQIRILVKRLATAPSATVPFYVRVIDTTQMAARWTVNGYQAFFALNNLSDNASAAGYIVYYSQAGDFLAADLFSVGPNGSAQIVRPSSVPIAGQLVGGVRLIFSVGNAGQVRAQEYNYNVVSGQYLTFEFGPVFQSAAGVQF